MCGANGRALLNRAFEFSSKPTLMKPKFKARELWLLAPFVLLGAGALYRQRLEKVAPIHAPGFHLEKFRMERASPYLASQGYSHKLTLTFYDSTPFTLGPGNTITQGGGNDALHPYAPFYYPQTPAQMRNQLTGGQALTVASQPPNQKEHSQMAPDFVWKDHQCVITQYLRLDSVPRDKGAVTFHSAYWILGRPVFVVKRVVRAANAPAPPPVDHTPGAKIVQVVATPFRASPCGPGSKPGCLQDEVEVDVAFRRVRALSPAKDKQRIAIDNIAIIDNQNRIYRPDWMTNFSVAVPFKSPTLDALKSQVAPDNSVAGVTPQLYQSFQTKGRLTLRATLSVDGRWPIPFEVALPPRPAAKVAAPNSKK